MRKSIVNDKEIKGFFDDYRWLSNFYPCNVEFENLVFPSSENAYQAAKVVPEARDAFLHETPNVAKRLWKKFPLLDKDTWDARKYDVMLSIVRDKFSRNNDLRDLLISTGDKYLEEKNSWHDNYWGNCECKRCVDGRICVNISGQNKLGEILMKVRSEL